MVDMLDAMQQLMTGDLEYFDPAFLNELGQCWDDTHPDLRQAEDNAWQGMIDFFENDGWGIDPWGINGTTDQGRYSVLLGGSCGVGTLTHVWGHKYRVTQHVGSNLPLTSIQKFRLGLARPGQGWPKWNFCFDVNGKFCGM